MIGIYGSNDLFATWGRIILAGSLSHIGKRGDVLVFTEGQLRAFTSDARYYRKTFAEVCIQLGWAFVFPGALDDLSRQTRRTLDARSRHTRDTVDDQSTNTRETLANDSRDTRGMVHIRNFARKQGFDPTVRGDDAGENPRPRLPPSPSPNPNTKKRGKRRNSPSKFRTGTGTGTARAPRPRKRH